MDDIEARLRRLEEFKAQWDAAHSKPHPAFEVLPTLEESPVVARISVPTDDLMQKVGNYITWVETAMTKDVCKCERIPHPSQNGTYKGETSLDCPAHSKEGLVLGFFEWLRQWGQHPALPDTAMGTLPVDEGPF